MKKIKISLYEERLLTSRDIIIEHPECEVLLEIADPKLFEYIEENFGFGIKLKISDNKMLKNLCYLVNLNTEFVKYAVFTELIELNEYSVFSEFFNVKE